MRTTGAVLWELNAPWSVEEIELDPPREYEREPCRSAHDQTRLMLGIDVVIALVGIAIVARKYVTDRRPTPTEEPAPTP